MMVDAVEVRREVVHVARKYFGLAPDPSFEVTIADAADWVVEAPDNAYDAVYVDLFSGKGLSEVALRQDFMSHLQRIVRPGGLLSFNLIGDRRVNTTIARRLALVTRSVWAMRGVRKSNLALFGVKDGRIDPALCLTRAKRADRRAVLPFRINGHVRRMERLYIEGMEKVR